MNQKDERTRLSNCGYIKRSQSHETEIAID
jgi:hypothetical protein